MGDWRGAELLFSLRVLGEYALLKSIPKIHSAHYKGKGE